MDDLKVFVWQPEWNVRNTWAVGFIVAHDVEEARALARLKEDCCTSDNWRFLDEEPDVYGLREFIDYQFLE